MVYVPKEYWEKRSGKYLRWEGLKSLRHIVNAPLVDWILKRELRRIGPQSLLEVGCGPGRLFGFYRDVPRVCAVDFSSSMLERARENVLSRGLRHIELGEMPCQDLRFEEDDFDLVMTVTVLIHIPPAEVDRAIEELVRVSCKHIIVVEGSYSGGSPGTRSAEHVFFHDYRALFCRAGAYLIRSTRIPFLNQECMVFYKV